MISVQPNLDRTTKIVVVGPAPGQTGGIASVMSYLQGQVDDSAFDLTFVDTLKSGRWSFTVFFGAITKLLYVLIVAKLCKRPVVVHLNVASRGSTYRKFLVSVFCRVIAVPYLCHLHGARYRTFYAKSSPFVKRIVKSLFGASARVLVLGAPWKEHVIGDLGVQPDKVVTIPNGTMDFRTAVAAAEGTSTHVRLVYSGRLETRKGLPELLEACDQLQLQNQSFELVLMGDSRDASLLQQAEIRQYCRVTGWLPKQRLKDEMASADIFVLPSYDEGLPMAMIEAMSMGLPVVVTPVGGIPDVIGNGREGFLVPVGDVNGLVEALVALTSSRSLRIRMGSEARLRWESDLTAERMTRRIESQWIASLESYKTKSEGTS